MATTNKPVTLGVVGIGGYARRIGDLVLDHGSTSSPPVRLAAVSDPAIDDHPQRVEQLHAHGVEVLRDLEQLLERDEIEAIWLPLPIHLHRRFAERSFAAGKPVMCEKPLAGTIQDVDAMIGARDSAAGGQGVPAAVGFQHIYPPETLALKRRMLRGEWGPLHSATIQASIPRADAYFQRNQWAGAVQRDGVWVLDSPANNACAHFINLALFLLGPNEAESATPVAVEAELYRTAAIENYDTISMRLTLETGQTLLVLMTHASSEMQHAVITLRGEHGSIRYAQHPEHARRRFGDEVEIVGSTDLQPNMLERFARLVRGMDDDRRAVATFEAARKHTLAINGASAIAPIVDVPESVTESVASPNGGTIQAITGISQAFDACVQSDMMLDESGLLEFTQTPGRMDLSGYDYFAGLAEHSPVSRALP